MVNNIDKNVKINWLPIIVGFLITIALLPVINAIAPLIGGAVVGYLVGGNYKNGVINGAISACSGSLVYAVLIDVFLSGAVISKAASINMPTNMVIIYSLILAIIGGLILGVIGGAIGILIKNKTKG
jgi:hypothetical protein